MELLAHRTWRALLGRGWASILFAATLVGARGDPRALVVLFGAYAMFDGVLSIHGGLRRCVERSISPLVLGGLVSFVLGAAILSSLADAAHHIHRLIAVWALPSGAFELGLAMRVRTLLPSEVSLVFGGAGALLLGLVMLVWPYDEGRTAVALVVACGFFLGPALLIAGARLRRRSRWIRDMVLHLAGVSRFDPARPS
jgi:uncharacterized membrane protein HdeD (DUF308 family)